jgi:hypothetical protein
MTKDLDLQRIKANDALKDAELRSQLEAVFQANAAGDTQRVLEIGAKLPEKLINANIQIINEERVHVRKLLDNPTINEETSQSGKRYLQVLGDYVHLLRQSLKFVKTENPSGLEAQQSQGEAILDELHQLSTSPALKDIISGRLSF